MGISHAPATSAVSLVWGLIRNLNQGGGLFTWSPGEALHHMQPLLTHWNLSYRLEREEDPVPDSGGLAWGGVGRRSACNIHHRVGSGLRAGC